MEDCKIGRLQHWKIATLENCKIVNIGKWGALGNWEVWKIATLEDWKVVRSLIFFGWVAQGVAERLIFRLGNPTLVPIYDLVSKIHNCLQIQCPSVQLSSNPVSEYATVSKSSVPLRNCHQI